LELCIRFQADSLDESIVDLLLLQEPAFKELVLLYNADTDEDSMEAGLQLQTYRGIPLPDLKVLIAVQPFGKILKNQKM
jgi:hypothetical protein